MHLYIEDLIKRLSPKLRAITFRLNGRFTFFDHDDLFQEALEHIYMAFGEGRLIDKTDSYILQGCYYHLKNYIRKSADRAATVSLDQFIADGEEALGGAVLDCANGAMDAASSGMIMEAISRKDLSPREREVLHLALDGLTVREIGKRLGISHVMVVKIKKGMAGKLRDIRNSFGDGYQN